jgi:hypothetical protein
LSRPPSSSTTGSWKLRMPARVRSGAVAMLSLYQATPPISATFSSRCGTA